MTRQYAEFLARLPPDRAQEWAAWVAARPPQIQRAIERFPPGSTWTHSDGERWYLLGWSEQKDSDDVSLIFSVFNPFEDHAAAGRQENRRYACMSHFDVGSES